WVRVLSLLFRNDEFQSGPDSVDRTDLDIDEANGKRVSRTTTSVRSVASLADFFGHDTQIAPSGAPTTRYPAACRRAQPLRWRTHAPCVKGRLRPGDHLHAGRQWTNKIAIRRRRAADQNAKARLVDWI